MSDVPVDPIPTPVTPTPATGEGIAERYVEKELVESRASLKRTQIISAIVAIGLVGYLAVVTSRFHSNLEPNGAAEIATGLASQRVDDMTPQFASYVREEVPKAIRNVPDEVIKRLPEYRENLEKRVENELRLRSGEASKRLHTELTAFLTEHKDKVGDLIKNGNDPAAVEEMGKGLEDQFRKFLKEQDVAGSSIQSKLNSTLNTLTLVEKRTARLAANKGLNPSEQKARHAVAMLMHRIDDAKATSDPLPTLDPNKVREAVDQVHQGMSETADKARATLSATAGSSGAPAAGTKPAPAGAKPPAPAKL